jgi:hypothetical protein
MHLARVAPRERLRIERVYPSQKQLSETHRGRAADSNFLTIGCTAPIRHSNVHALLIPLVSGAMSRARDDSRENLDGVTVTTAR